MPTPVRMWGPASKDDEVIRILCLFDYVAHTGYATVSKNIIPRLKKIFAGRVKFDICAVNYFGDMYIEDDGTTVFSAIKTLPPEVQLELSKMNDKQKLDDYGRVGFGKILQDSAIPQPDDLPGEKGYDGIFIINDMGVILPLTVMFNEIKKKMKANNWKQFKSIFYFPVDCAVIPEIIEGIESWDGIVTYNEYGRSEILKVKPNLRGRVKVIPHGCNINDFYPLWDRRSLPPLDLPLRAGWTEARHEFRKNYFGEANADKFIVLNLNRNQHRKDIPATIFGFQEYKKRNPNSLLYLHMHGRDPMGWDIRALMWQTGLKEGVDYMLPPQDVQDKGCPVQMINEIYNACDVYLTTTRGEGWGLSVTEAMACRLPVICPLNTSFTEITANGKRAWLLENQFPIASRADNIIRMQVDLDEVADMLAMVHEDIQNKKYCIEKGMLQKKRLDEKLDAAYEYVVSLHWDGIAQRWAEVFKEVY